MIGKKRLITDDLFDIASRIRSIDEGYFILYSYKDRRYEVHNRLQVGNTFSFFVPYEKLDFRTLEYARRTSTNRIRELIDEMNRENEKYEQGLKKQVLRSFDF